MKLSQYAYLAFAMSGAVIASSCIRDEIPDCPALKVNVVVKDKNYFNVDKVELEERVADDLPFRDYVPNIHWALRDVETGDVVDSSNGSIRINGDQKSFTPSICPCIPHGTYVLTVWGGVESNDHLSENFHQINFHPGNTQGADVYMTNDTIVYDAWHNDHTVELERTKGKLIIEKVNIPSQIVKTEKNISGIYATLLHHDFAYSGETSVRHILDIEDRLRTVSKTFLAPSIKKDGTLLNLRFLSETGESDIPTKNVYITMRRNELTVLRYVWDAQSRSFRIYIKVNDSWELVNDMGLE